MRSDYLGFRRRYEPKEVRVVFIAESPPRSGRYFYNPKGRVTEPLFAAMMKLIGCRSTTKEEGLRAFQEKGFILVDATYVPVNGLRDKERNQAIERNLPELMKDLRKVMGARKVPILLIKANVCRLLEARLRERGLTVLNDGVIVPFPACGNQRKFHRKVSPLLKLFR